MQRSRQQVESALEKKGFKRNNGDHSRFIYFTVEGKKTAVRTKTSRGSGHKSVGAPLLGQMAKQCGLSKPDFLNLVDCALDRTGYEQKLRNQLLV